MVKTEEIEKDDFLKYWRVVRFWAKAKYKLPLEDLELLLFLYSKKRFTLEDFKIFNGIMNWDPPRFTRMIEEGWITPWGKSKKRLKKKYQLTYKSRKLVHSIYKKLRGEEHISEDRRRNPIFDKKQYCYTHTMYGRIIKYMNDEFKTVREYKAIAKETEL